MAELQAKEYKKFEEIKHIDNDGHRILVCA